VGRDAELLILQNVFRDVMADAKTRVVTIVGDAGVGKSRLLYEFERWIESLPNQFTRLRGRATLEMQNVPYSIVRDVFASSFGIRESDSAAVALEKFRAGTAAVLEPEKADLIGHLIGFDFSASRAVSNLLGSQSFTQLAVADLINYLRAVAAAATVIFLEDVHWADDSSLDLLEHVVTAIPNARLLIVCLARPRLFERHPRWGKDRAAYARLDLKPLSRRASRALVDEILQRVEQIPDDLRDLVVGGAEGNPFYVEELIKMLIEDGVILRGEERWRVELERLAEVRVPPTLTGILQARLDSLPREEKTLLQRASVVGRLFWDEAVIELAGDEAEAAQVNGLLDAVGNRELVFRQERSVFEGTGEYIFKHAILRDVTYEMVLLKLRRVYHAQVAQWLEASARERIGEYLSLIARHYELAGERAKAADYLRRAGIELGKISAFRDALRAFEQALALLPTASLERAPLIVRAGEMLVHLGDFAAARRCLEEGLALARRHGDDVSRAVALGHLGAIACDGGDFDEARERLEESLALARQLDDQIQVAYALGELGNVELRQGAYAQARNCFAKSLTLYRSQGRRRGVAATLNRLGAIAVLSSEYREAEDCFTESLALCRELGDRRGMARALGNLGETVRQRGDYATAQGYYRKAMTVSQEIGYQLNVAINLANMGNAAVALDDDTAAARYYREAMHKALEIGVIPYALDDLVGLAGVMARAGRAERALELLGLALHHPAIWGETRSTIESLLTDLRAKLPPDVVEAGLERGKSLELEAAAEILEGT
jgi:predicted ATPase